MNGLLFECGPINGDRDGCWLSVNNPNRLFEVPVALQFNSGTGTLILEGRNGPNDTPVTLASVTETTGVSVPAFPQMRVRMISASSLDARVSVGAVHALRMERIINVFPGDDLLGIYAAASPGDVVQVWGSPTELVTEYDLGTAALTPTNNFVSLVAAPGYEPVKTPKVGRWYPLGLHSVAPRIKLVTTGPNVVNWTNCHGMLIDGFEVSGGTYASGVSGSGVGILRGTRSVIRNNLIRNNDVCGISGENSSSKIEGNELTECSLEAVSGVSGAIKMSGSRMLVRRNYIHHNNVYGVWRDCNSPSWYIVDNIIEDNVGSGIFNEISRGGTIRGNYIARNSPHTGGRFEVVITSSEDVLFKNNVVDSGGTPDSPVQAMYIREDDKAGVADSEDKDYNSEVTNPCQIGFRTDNVVVERNTFLNGAFLRIQWDNVTPAAIYDHLVDASHENENDTTAPQLGVIFRGNVNVDE